MSWLAIPSVLRRELYALAEEVGGWSEGRARSKLHAVFRTVEEAAQGKKVKWEGLEIDPRYRLKNQTIINILEITPEEEWEMKTIISDEERRRRDRERKNPQMSRREYEGRAAERRAEAQKMAGEGFSDRQIAEHLGISRQRVNQLLKKPLSDG
jgi:DNA-binding CsgD family transcriptional regulator